MRLLLFIVGIGVGLVGIGNRADAQNYPWCSIYTDGLGGENCGFTTFQQCLANVSGIGGFCERWAVSVDEGAPALSLLTSTMPCAMAPAISRAPLRHVANP